MGSKKSTWNGLSDDTLLGLEHYLCRLTHRLTLFKGDGTDQISRVCAVVAAAVEWLDGRGVELPPKQHLAEKVLDVKPSALSKFLKGTPGKATKWVQRAQTLLAFIMTGEKAVPKSKAVAARIDDYFFRGLDDGPVASYFRPERCTSSHAWSYTELAYEVAWFARSVTRSESEDAELWFVSGGPKFFDAPQDDTCEAIRLCLEQGVSVKFLYPEGSAGAAGSAAYVDGAQSVPVPPSASILPDFFTPVTRYLLTAPDTLWILRDDSNQTSGVVEDAPRAIRAFDAERSAFVAWLQLLKGELPMLATTTAEPGESSGKIAKKKRPKTS